MLAGTESPGRLYRFDADDRPFVLLDSGLTELRAIASTPDGDDLSPPASLSGDDAASRGGETTSVATLASAAARAGARRHADVGDSSAPSARSLYRIDPSGTWEADLGNRAT